MIEFVKAHGTGNDFVVIGDLDDKLTIPPDAVRKLCDRRFGVGADGVIRIVRRPGAFLMDYRNHDGSYAEMCGNGTRVTGKWLADRGHVGDTCDIETLGAGIKHLTLHKGADGKVETVVVDMGQPSYTDQLTETLHIDGEEFELSAVSVGNPHAVLFVDDVDNYPLNVVGPLIQAQRDRFPEGVNVGVATVEDSGTIRERTYERGAGETLACGTCASAVAVTAQRRGFVGENITMHIGGGVLQFSWRDGESIFMTGPAVEVFGGSFDPADFGITIQS